MVLITQQSLVAGPSLKWHNEVLDDLSIRLTAPSAFPCVFSQNAFKRLLLLFHFVEADNELAQRECTNALTQYVQLSREWDGELNTANPLIIAFSLDCISSDSVTEYHQFGWKIIQKWHEHDSGKWPEEVSIDPHLPFWSFCFSGLQLFVNMSCPAHRQRLSRNLGSHFIFIVNPRERFDQVAGDTPDGRRIRGHIRSRIHAYDGQGHSPQLGSYEVGEIEWWQYGLLEENRARTDRCPFVHKQNRGVL